MRAPLHDLRYSSPLLRTGKPEPMRRSPLSGKLPELWLLSGLSRSRQARCGDGSGASAPELPMSEVASSLPPLE